MYVIHTFAILLIYCTNFSEIYFTIIQALEYVKKPADVDVWSWNFILSIRWDSYFEEIQKVKLLHMLRMYISCILIYGLPYLSISPCIYYHRLNTNNFKVPLAEHFYVLSRKILCVSPIGVHILAVAQSRIPACAFCTRQARFAQILPMYVTWILIHESS